MASGVSVEQAAIRGGIGCCQTSIRELESAARELRQSYQQAGRGGWRDQKYAALGGIVDECCGALTRPLGELEDCMKKLNDLLRAVAEYEQVNL